MCLAGSYLGNVDAGLPGSSSKVESPEEAGSTPSFPVGIHEEGSRQLGRAELSLASHSGGKGKQQSECSLFKFFSIELFSLCELWIWKCVATCRC